MTDNDRKLTQAQIDRLLVSLDYPSRPQAYRRRSESRWWIPALLMIASIIVMAITAAIGQGIW